MLEIRKTNIISGNERDVDYGLIKILNFLELIGKNIIVLNCHDSKISIYYNNKKEFKNFTEFKELVDESGNLFRINLIVLNIWNKNIDTVLKYKSVLDEVGIDYILVSNTYKYENKNKDLTVSIIERENGKFYLNNRLTNERYSFSNYIIQYKRELKLRKFFQK